jgi:hypothetical protein
MANTQFTSLGTVQTLAAANPIRTSLVIQNRDTGTLFIGDASNLTTSTGIEIAKDDLFVMDFEGGTAQFFFRGAVYGIGTSVDVRVWEISDPRQ